MIILSQDKNSIINFHNILNIFISDSQILNKPKYSINYINLNGISKILGYYETETRARDILEDISESYCLGENIYSIPEE